MRNQCGNQRHRRHNRWDNRRLGRLALRCGAGFLPAALLLLLFAAAQRPVLAQDLTGRVVGVSDGDTITMLSEGNKPVKVRFHRGIEDGFADVIEHFTAGVATEVHGLADVRQSNS